MLGELPLASKVSFSTTSDLTASVTRNLLYANSIHWQAYSYQTLTVSILFGFREFFERWQPHDNHDREYTHLHISFS